jgi:hypothetical protein
VNFSGIVVINFPTFFNISGFTLTTPIHKSSNLKAPLLTIPTPLSAQHLHLGVVAAQTYRIEDRKDNGVHIPCIPNARKLLRSLEAGPVCSQPISGAWHIILTIIELLIEYAENFVLES